MAAEVAVVIKASDRTKGVFEGVGQRMNKLASVAKTAFIGVGVGVAAAGAVITKFTLDAAKAEQSRNTFEKLAQSVGGTLPTATEKLRKATRGMVKDYDLWLAGNKFLAMGLAETEDQAAELAEMATQLGMAMGEDATASMENFALMLANQSIPRMDSFGMSSGKARLRIEELMKTNAGMTREQAFTQAVLEQGRVTMEKVGEQSEATAGQMAQFQTVLSNLKLEMGRAFLPILTKVMSGLLPLAKILAKYLVPLTAKFAKTLENMATRVGKRIAPFIKLLERLPEAFRWLRDGDVDMFLERLWVAMDMAFGDRAADLVRDFGERISGLADHISDFIGTARAFAGRVGDVAHAIRNVLGGWEFLGLEQLKVSLAELVGPRVAGVIAGFVEKILSIKNSLVGLWQKHIYPHLAPIKTGIETWWAGLGAEEGVLGKIGAGWQRYIAAPLTGFYTAHLEGPLSTIGEKIGTWWTRMGGITGILGRIGEGWRKYIADPLTGFYTDHLQSPLASIGMGISAWWSGLSEGDGIMIKIAAGWNKYIAMPLQGFWEAHLAEPFETLKTRIGEWAQTIWDFILHRIIEPLKERIPGAAKDATEEIAGLAEEVGKLDKPEPPRPWYLRPLDAFRDLTKEFEKQQKLPIAKRTGVLGQATFLWEYLVKIAQVLKEIALMKWTELLTALAQIRAKWDDITGAVEKATERTKDQEMEYGWLEGAVGLYGETAIRVNESILGGLDNQISRMQAARREWDLYRAELQRPITIPTPSISSPVISRPTTPMPGYEDIWPEREYQYGGTVPGPIGRPQIATVHGGETIIPAGRGGGVTFDFRGAQFYGITQDFVEDLFRENEAILRLQGVRAGARA